MNKKKNFKQYSNSKNKKKANLNNQNNNKKKNETLPLIQEENRNKSEKKNIHQFMSNNKATKKSYDIFANHPTDSKLFLKNKEDVKQIENSFRRTFDNNLRQNISNKYGRVSSANKLSKLKNNYENMNNKKQKKNSTKRKEDVLNNKEDEIYDEKDLLKEKINEKDLENQEDQLLKEKLNENEKEKENVELKENQDQNNLLKKENTTKEKNGKEEKDIGFTEDILSNKFKVNYHNSKVLFHEEFKKNINQSMDYGKSKNHKNILDNQKDSNPIISNSKENNLHAIVNESNKNTQKKEDGLKKSHIYNGSTWNMKARKDNSKRLKLREKTTNLFGQKKMKKVQ